MKLKMLKKREKLKKKAFERLGIKDDDSDDAPSNRPSWMIVGKDKQKAAVKEAQAMSAKNMPPELWFKDGDEKKVRFRHDGPIALIFRYSVRVKGKWRQFTAPDPDGDGVDVFRDEMGLTPQLRAIYEVIDIKGYTDKQGKRKRNMPKFLNCNTRMHQQLENIGRKRGPINTFDIEITREGEGTKTTYLFLPESPTSMTPEMKSAPSLKPEFAKYYAPPTEQEQQSLVGRATTRRDEDDDTNNDDDDD